MSDESTRLAHHAAEARARESAVPAPSPQPAVSDHAAEVMASHEGKPTVAEQQKRTCYP